MFRWGKDATNKDKKRQMGEVENGWRMPGGYGFWGFSRGEAEKTKVFSCFSRKKIRQRRRKHATITDKLLFFINTIKGEFL